MRKLFGTDGIRAVAGEAPLDAKTIHAVGVALARKLAGSGKPVRVVLGMDTRESGPWIASTLIGGLRQGGAEAEFAGVITTPAIAFLAKKHQFAAGVVISASHNPWQDNGIKVFGGNGYKLPDATEIEIEAEIFRRLQDGPPPDPSVLSAPPADKHFREEYEAFLRNVVPGLNLRGKKIVIDCANGAAAVIAAELFPSLGGEIHLTHVTPNGRNINDHCGALHPETVAKETKALGADLGITFDGDADRALFADAQGC